MLTQEQAVEVRVLARRGGKVKEIARELGVSKNTVKRYLRDPQAGRYKRRAPRPRKLDVYLEYLQERIEAAQPRWIPATVLLREIRERGYEGGISQLKTYLAPFKATKLDPVVRFETAPGEQMQADFTTIRRGHSPLKAFVATLGFSRATFVRFTEREDSETLLSCLRQAFQQFGGVTAEILFDNATTIVVERDAYGPGNHRWHAGLKELADEYGFRPRLCRPYRARTKGKVERFNGYLKGSFVTPLAATLKSAGLLLDATTANAHIGRWVEEVAHQRDHGTTGEKPGVRLDTERLALLPLPILTMSPTPASSWRFLNDAALPIESIQHPLAVYEQLLEVRA
jgi:transposase